jgi:hypothetical protein
MTDPNYVRTWAGDIVAAIRQVSQMSLVGEAKTHFWYSLLRNVLVVLGICRLEQINFLCAFRFAIVRTSELFDYTVLRCLGDRGRFIVDSMME